MTDAADNGTRVGGLETVLGSMLLDLVTEWERVQGRTADTHVQGLLRVVYGELALQVSVRARELRAAGGDPQELEQILSKLRSQFADAVATIKD